MPNDTRTPEALRCSKCRERLPLDQFPPSTIAKGAGYCRPCSAKYQREWSGKRPRVPRPCNACGEMFMRWDEYAHPGSAATHCHPCYLRKVRERMARRDKRETGKARALTELSADKLIAAMRAEMLAEENPTCGLCGGAIDPEAKHGDTLAAQVDHVIPEKAGGSKFGRHNLQLAHAQCNQRANDKGYRIWRQHPMPRVDHLGLAF